MAVDLSELIENVKDTANPPGTNLYPDATDDNWFNRLINAFWEIRLQGMLDNFEENSAARGGPTPFSEGIITPLKAEVGYDDGSFAGPSSTTPDLGRELQQLIVLWAAYKAAIKEFQNMRARFRAKAGPVEFEEETSAIVLKSLLDGMKDEIKVIMYNLSSFGVGRGMAVYDAIIEKSYNTSVGETWWVR